MLQCIYCLTFYENYKTIIQHLIDAHTYNEIKFKQSDGKNSKIVSYKLTPDMCREQGRAITVDENNSTINVSRRDVLPKDSPMKKILRQGEIIGDTQETIVEEENIEVAAGVEESDLDELTSMLPGVIQALKECGRYDDYKSFNQLISAGRFPLDNIAFLLFLDVVRWYSLDKSTTFMRYSDECKLFWRTGSRLFHGRFLRFMGGPKNKGQVCEGESVSGKYSADDSTVNFVIPDRRVLKEESKIVTNDQPGIITGMIQDVSRNDPDHILTYKICVDGKKINPSSKGEINLWGYEDQPTFDAKRQRLDNEMDSMHSYIRKMESQIEMGHYMTCDLTNTEKDNAIDSCKRSVTILSNRIKDLRMLKVRKEIALKKLQEQVQGDWRSSRYAIVISSLRTNIYQMENCIEDMLNANEKLCKYAAVTSTNTTISYSTTDIVDLSCQENYVCLGNTSDLNDPKLIKQRSPAWQNVRQTSLVTGSTINKAIGMDGLKQQKCYLDTKTGRKEPEHVSDELQRRFDYGTENELNAVATMVSTFIPAFEPGVLFYEEGCYVLEEGGKTFLVVSPDGSVRNEKDDQHPQAAVEIKCPIPGKLYTTPIHYKLPHYYVPQVLSEMCCIGVEKLYFVSYGNQSTAVHLVEFDKKLWSDICVEIKNLDAEHTPKKLNPNVSVLKSSVVEFCNTKVRLVAEVKSKIAKACDHSPDETGRIYHENRNKFHERIFLSDLQKTLIRASDAVKMSDSLCSQKANEVLVFLLADLDRIHKPEIPNAFPVAYAFKGYSMKATVMRTMIEDVLHELCLQGIYTPVISYDGQWAVLAYKAKDGEALTLLELQKQVYNEVKATKKNEVTKLIFETGVVKPDETLSTQIDYVYDEQRKAVYVAHKAGIKLFRTSSNTQHLLATVKTNVKNVESKNDESDGNHEILSVVPTEILNNLNDDEIQVLQDVDGRTDRSQQTNTSNIYQETVNLQDTIFADIELGDDDGPSGMYLDLICQHIFH